VKRDQVRRIAAGERLPEDAGRGVGRGARGETHQDLLHVRLGARQGGGQHASGGNKPQQVSSLHGQVSSL
jgi:hypothetical protein